MIKARDLCKNFASYDSNQSAWANFFKRKTVLKKAVCQVDLDISKGEIVGLLGPNGAGKTTLMKMFTGIIVPSSGTLQVLGKDPWQREREFKKKIALVMGQKSQLWWDLSAMDSFLLLQKIYQIDDHDFKNKVGPMGEMLGVSDLFHRQVRKLSLGERMKMELMACLLHSPSLVFLDEPTIGLDLISQERMRQFIREIHRQTDLTIVLTSHYMADVEELCHRIVLIQEGMKKFDGPIDQFKSLAKKKKKLSFTFAENQDPKESFWSHHRTCWSEENRRVDLDLSLDEFRKTAAYVLEHFPVIDMSTSQTPVEDVMKDFMTGEL